MENNSYKTSDPILSIVIPVYNNDRFLQFCLDSLLVYQVADKQKYELIVINDGSTDNSPSIIQRYAQKHSNLHVINQRNSGVLVARNKGIRASKGQYIWFVDGDDFVKENCIESILEMINSGFDVYHFNGFRINQGDFYPNIMFEEVEGEMQPWFVTYVFSLEFLRKYKIEFEKGIRYCEDQLFMNDISIRKPTCFTVNRIYYFYRMNSYSATASNRQKKISGYFDLFETLINRLDGPFYTNENSLQNIESILRMRFLYAMDDNSIVTPEQLKRGKELSRRVNSFIAQHTIPNNLRKAFKNYEKLCKNFESKRWKNCLLKWRKNIHRKRFIKDLKNHPRRFLRKVLKGKQRGMRQL